MVTFGFGLYEYNDHDMPFFHCCEEFDPKFFCTMNAYLGKASIIHPGINVRLKCHRPMARPKITKKHIRRKQSNTAP